MKNCRFVISLVILPLLAACGFSEGGPKGEKIVKSAFVEQSTQHEVAEFPGRVQAAKEVNLAFKVSGTLQQIPVKEGEFVKEGEIVAIMDDKDYRVQYEAVVAEHANVKAQAERVFAIYADSAGTPQLFDNARYGLAQMEAKLENARNQLSYTLLRAPFDCYVQKHIVEQGSVVAAGMPVITIISAGVPEVEINIPASEYINRANFREFSASFDFMPGKRMELRPVSIAPKANANQLYTMRLRFVNNDGEYPSAGMNTLVQIKSYSNDSLYTMVPASALFSREGRSYLWLCRDGVVTEREVSVKSLDLEGHAILKSGVAAGDEIVVAGVHTLHEGERVRIMPKVSGSNVGGLL